MLLNILLKQREHYLFNFKRVLIYYQEEVAGHLKTRAESIQGTSI